MTLDEEAVSLALRSMSDQALVRSAGRRFASDKIRASLE